MRRIACALLVGAWGLSAGSASAQDCVWRPWASSWSSLNKGADLAPPNQVYNPTNWDFSLTQSTLLNLPKNTPDGSTLAFHWFLDSQPPATSSNGSGSGGLYQEFTVQSGVPLKYSFWWKGGQNNNTSWYEFMLIDGPFTTYDADQRDGATNPYIMRKRESATFGWEQLTDQSAVYGGPVQSTLTPTGDTVTVVLKAGRSPAGAMEAFYDDVQVWQGTGPNLVVDGDFEDATMGADCDNQLMHQDGTAGNYWFALTQCPGAQHTIVGPVDPATHDNDSDTTMTITGTNLDLVEQARLVPVGGGTALVGTNLVAGAGNTTLTVAFPTTGATDGVYDVVTTQAASPPCLIQTLAAAFELTCPTTAVVGDVSPGVVTDPTGSVQLTVVGTHLDLITGASLRYGSGSGPNLNATMLTMDGDDLLASFDMSCSPAGAYDLVLDRSDACRGTTITKAVSIVKTPLPGGCVWQPWAASWSALNLGPDLDPPNLAYDATNWDYTFSQHPNLGTALDTPDGSDLALHWFLDGQAGYGDNGLGSGGVFQEITVQAGVALEYSFQWKGASDASSSWFEFLLVDGPFNMLDADAFQENAAANNPSMIRKRSMDAGSFGWEQLTDQSPADIGPAGPRPQTITPTGSVVTVILKAGRSPGGSMESLWDNVTVSQNGGENLVSNGNFESSVQAGTCDREAVSQFPCELNSWRRSMFVQLHCSDPFADADGDGDVDQADFALFQACFTGSGTFTIPESCACFDRPEPIDPDGDIDQADLFKFEACASGPGIAANPACDD